MSLSRTNYCTNPAATGTGAGFSLYFPGTSETGNTTWVTGASDGPVPGLGTYGRWVPTAAKTAGSSGWRSDTTTSMHGAASGIAGNSASAGVWIRYTGAGTATANMRASVYTGATLINSNDTTSITLLSGVWHWCQSTVIANAAYDSVGWWLYQTSTQAIPVGASLDATGALIGPTGAFFDGATTSVSNKTYAWTGTADASTSTETITLPTTTATPFTDAPCPRVGVTIDGLGTGSSTYNLWRTADGVRKIVRNGRGREAVDSDFVIDYETPLGRPVLYDVEVTDGVNASAVTFPDTVTLTSDTWWIQNPLVPSSAMPLAVNHQDTSIPTLTAAAVKSLEYAADITIIPILGSSEPVALMGGRRLPSGVDFSMFTRAAEATTALRNLLQQTPLLLVRTNGVRNDGIPGLAYFACAAPLEQPVTVAFGGTLTSWQLQGSLVAAPSLNVLVPIWTYGTVYALWSTYSQAQTALDGKSYLDVLKSPSGA